MNDDFIDLLSFYTVNLHFAKGFLSDPVNIIFSFYTI